MEETNEVRTYELQQKFKSKDDLYRRLTIDCTPKSL